MTTPMHPVHSSQMTPTLSEQDQRALQQAKNLLENPGLAAKLTGVIGTPIEKGLSHLPADWKKSVGEIAQAALIKAADTAIFTMKDTPGEASSNLSHKVAAAASGAMGGAFGLAGLALELPLSTTIVLRSIVDIARSEGASIQDVRTKLACLTVFALGGKSSADDGSESGYFAVRTALASAVAEAAQHLMTKNVAESGAPVLVRLITMVARQFGLQVTQKAAAQAVPAIGAMGGALINTMFIDHYQDMARGHFVVLRLEQQYGADQVRAVYQTLPKLA